MVTQSLLRIYEGKQAFTDINFRFTTALNFNICPEHFKWPNLLQKCAPISELPSNIRTMMFRVLNCWKHLNQGELSSRNLNVRLCETSNHKIALKRLIGTVCKALSYTYAIFKLGKLFFFFIHHEKKINKKKEFKQLIQIY